MGDSCSHLNLVGHSQVQLFRIFSVWCYAPWLWNALLDVSMSSCTVTHSFNKEQNIPSHSYLSSLTLPFPSLRWTGGNDTAEDE